MKTVMQSIVAAQPDQLENAQFLLEGLVRSLNQLDSAARRDPSIVSKSALQGICTTLAHAGVLNNIALGSVERQMTRAGLQPADSGFTVQARG